ncbi:MAG: tRNA dihydrouridine synthase DusB [Candidatus Tectomicrobia bacterium]|nr:tRNA dihydrouridine synthase DusB [Candidatus Tectomicrobia bacterium]
MRCSAPRADAALPQGSAAPPVAAGFRIGPVLVSNPFLLAPLSGYSDAAMRLIAREEGAGFAFTEMISCIAYLHDSRRTLQRAAWLPEEKPFGLQLMGADADLMRRAAEKAQRDGADLLDINMGCPARRIVRAESGSALMRSPESAERIMRATVASVDIPVTVKLRSGWSREIGDARAVAEAAEAAGIAAITVHGRTQTQKFAGKADWEVIQAVKERVRIPVIGNGDVETAVEAVARMRGAGCDGVMIGRGAIGRPWLFAASLALLTTGMLPEPPGGEALLRLMLRHLGYLQRLYPAGQGLLRFRKHCAAYLRGWPQSKALRAHLHTLCDPAAVEAALVGYFSGGHASA